MLTTTGARFFWAPPGRYLVLQNLQDAHTLIRHVVQRYVDFDPAASAAASKVATGSADAAPIVVTRIALLNFCQLLVLAAERTAPQVFSQLRTHYQPWLQQNPNFGPVRPRPFRDQRRYGRGRGTHGAAPHPRRRPQPPNPSPSSLPENSCWTASARCTPAFGRRPTRATCSATCCATCLPGPVPPATMHDGMLHWCASLYSHLSYTRLQNQKRQPGENVQSVQDTAGDERLRAQKLVLRLLPLGLVAPPVKVCCGRVRNVRRRNGQCSRAKRQAHRGTVPMNPCGSLPACTTMMLVGDPERPSLRCSR